MADDWVDVPQLAAPPKGDDGWADVPAAGAPARPQPPISGTGIGATDTANNSQITGIQTLEIPAGMAPADAIKWAKDQGAKSGAKVKLPNGQMGTVP